MTRLYLSFTFYNSQTIKSRVAFSMISCVEQLISVLDYHSQKTPKRCKNKNLYIIYENYKIDSKEIAFKSKIHNFVLDKPRF